jgi:hypothetical protein
MALARCSLAAQGIPGIHSRQAPRDIQGSPSYVTIQFAAKNYNRR